MMRLLHPHSDAFVSAVYQLDRVATRADAANAKNPDAIRNLNSLLGVVMGAQRETARAARERNLSVPLHRESKDVGDDGRTLEQLRPSVEDRA